MLNNTPGVSLFKQLFKWVGGLVLLIIVVGVALIVFVFYPASSPILSVNCSSGSMSLVYSQGIDASELQLSYKPSLFSKTELVYEPMNSSEYQFDISQQPISAPFTQCINQHKSEINQALRTFGQKTTTMFNSLPIIIQTPDSSLAVDGQVDYTHQLTTDTRTGNAPLTVHFSFIHQPKYYEQLDFGDGTPSIYFYNSELTCRPSSLGCMPDHTYTKAGQYHVRFSAIVGPSNCGNLMTLDFGPVKPPAPDCSLVTLGTATITVTP